MEHTVLVAVESTKLAHLLAMPLMMSRLRFKDLRRAISILIVEMMPNAYEMLVTQPAQPHCYTKMQEGLA